MRKGYLAIGIAVALVLLVASLTPAIWLGAPAAGAVGDLDEVGDAEENETAETTPPVVAGGGWYNVVGEKTYKNTFGMLISGHANYTNMSAFVFQGRDLGMKIISVNFTQITFSNENKSVDAYGWCTANNTEGFWFHIAAADNGDRSLDTLSLMVYADSNSDGAMDEATASWSWETAGLLGGQIASGEEAEEVEVPEV